MSLGRHEHYVTEWGRGWDFKGRTFRISNRTFFDLMLRGQLYPSLPTVIAERVREARAVQALSLAHPGADAAAVSFDMA